MDTDPDPDRFRQLMVNDAPAFVEMLSCVFDMQRTRETYLALLGASGCTVAELAATLDRDRSNVSRSLLTLGRDGSRFPSSTPR